LPGILRNSRQKELKKNPHRDDFNNRQGKLHRKEAKKIRHRDDLHVKEFNWHNSQ
jgi:hypothetical protein